MQFLSQTDVNDRIFNDVLLQAVQGDLTVLDRREPEAISKMKSSLAARYAVNQIFYPTIAYSSGTNYKYFQRVSYTGNSYYVTPPALFDPTVNYSAGTKLTYNQRVYNVLLNTIAGQNYPTDSNYFTDITETFTVIAAGSALPTDTTKWTIGDGRNQLVVGYCVDILLHIIIAPISVRFESEKFDQRHKEALAWLRDVASGDINADLPELQNDTAGVSIAYGYNQKFNQSYNW